MTNTDEWYDNLVAQFSDQNSEVRHRATSRLLWSDDPRGVGLLLTALEDDSHRVRAGAALALRHYKSEKAVEPLIHHLVNDPNEHVRAVCAVALTPEDARQTEALIAALKDSDWHVRTSAAASLKDCSDIRINRLFLELLDAPSWHERQFICSLLVDRGFVNEDVMAAIDRVLLEPEAADYDEQMKAAGEFLQALMSEPELAECVDEFDGRSISPESRSNLRETMEDAREHVRFEEIPPMETLAELAERARRMFEARTDDV